MSLLPATNPRKRVLSATTESLSSSRLGKRSAVARPTRRYHKEAGRLTTVGKGGRKDLEETFVTFTDTSTNGTLWNEHRIHRQTLVLSDGDEIEIAGQTFVFHQTAPGAGGGSGEMIEHYWVMNRIMGSGSFGTVHLALSTETHTQVACKKILLKREDTSKMKNVRHEIRMLRQLDHPNINKMLDIAVDKTHINIFLELVSGGDLFSYLHKSSTISLSAPEAKFILFQLFKALKYLHVDKNISHHDLKLENVIVAGPGPFPKVMIADFGTAMVSAESICSVIGTLVYLSPEAISAKTRHESGYDGKKLDMWSSGIILSLLLSGCHPFASDYWEPQPPNFSPSDLSDSFIDSIHTPNSYTDKRDSSDAQTCANVLAGRLHLPGTSFGSEDKLARSLIVWLLAHSPQQRYTASQALASPWIKASEHELEKLWAKVCR
ncbi:cell-cycle checkpoint protein [Pseudohyphozyma bogoriensis]|nr:cell-cycle checkpoint protein [Pseudohyphozyma bogoriensis]